MTLTISPSFLPAFVGRSASGSSSPATCSVAFRVTVLPARVSVSPVPAFSVSTVPTAPTRTPAFCTVSPGRSSAFDVPSADARCSTRPISCTVSICTASFRSTSWAPVKPLPPEGAGTLAKAPLRHTRNWPSVGAGSRWSAARSPRSMRVAPPASAKARTKALTRPSTAAWSSPCGASSAATVRVSAPSSGVTATLSPAWKMALASRYTWSRVGLAPTATQAVPFQMRSWSAVVSLHRSPFAGALGAAAATVSAVVLPCPAVGMRIVSASLA